MTKYLDKVHPVPVVSVGGRFSAEMCGSWCFLHPTLPSWKLQAWGVWERERYAVRRAV